MLSRLVCLSTEELAELTTAASVLQRTGLEERALMLHSLADKLRALLETDALSRIEPDFQALTEAEGLADQTVERSSDGSMTVRFTAGGIKEIC